MKVYRAYNDWDSSYFETKRDAENFAKNCNDPPKKVTTIHISPDSNQPPNQVDAVCACGESIDIYDMDMWNHCPICGNLIEQD